MKRELLPIITAFVAFLFLYISPSIWAKTVGENISKRDEDLDLLLDMDLENLTVYVVSKRKEKVIDAPGVVTVITSDEIARFGVNNLHDILYRQPNMYVYGSMALPDNFPAIRGQTVTGLNNHTLVLFNGRPFRLSIDGGADPLAFTGFPIELVDRIEIIRGPGSVLYGSGAFGGTINIITKDLSKDWDSSVSQGYGSFNTWQTSGFFSAKSNDLELVFSGRFFDSNGWKYEVTDNTGFNGSIDRSRKTYGLWGQLKYKRITVSSFLGNRKETVLGVSSTWPQDITKTKLAAFFDIQYDQPISKNWRAQTNFTYNVGLIPEQSPDVDSKSRVNDFLFEGNIFGSLFDNKVNIVMGTTYQSLNGKFIPAGVASQSWHFDWYTFYAQADYHPWDFISLIAGLQVNKTPNVAENFSPRLGAIFHLHKNWGAKILYGGAFRSASGFEQVFILPGLIQGNPHLGPEKINTFDAQLFYASTNANASITYYQSKQTNSIVVVLPGGIISFANGGDVDFWGIEFEGKVNLLAGLQLIGSITYQENEDSMGNKDVGLVPNFMAKVGLSYSSPKGYSLGIFDTYFGDAAQLPGTLNFNPPAESYHWLSANLTFDVPRLANNFKLPGLKINIYAENLLDEEVFFPEWVNEVINTFPLRGGIAVYGNVTVNF